MQPFTRAVGMHTRGRHHFRDVPDLAAPITGAEVADDCPWGCPMHTRGVAVFWRGVSVLSVSVFGWLGGCCPRRSRTEAAAGPMLKTIGPRLGSSKLERRAEPAQPGGSGRTRYDCVQPLGLK